MCNNKTISLYTTLYYCTLNSYTFRRYETIVNRLHVSRTYEGENHIAVVIHSSVKPTAKISSLFVVINNSFTILLHILNCSQNVTFRHVSCNDEISAVGFTVSCMTTDLDFLLYTVISFRRKMFFSDYPNTVLCRPIDWFFCVTVLTAEEYPTWNT
jgi:hypothetical protein